MVLLHAARRAADGVHFKWAVYLIRRWPFCLLAYFVLSKSPQNEAFGMILDVYCNFVQWHPQKFSFFQIYAGGIKTLSTKVPPPEIGQQFLILTCRLIG